MVAGLAYAFLPFHVAHASRPSPRRADAVASALLPGLVARVSIASISAAPRCCSPPPLRSLSRTSTGLIAAVLSPVALVAYAVVRRARQSRAVASAWRSSAQRSRSAAAAGLVLIHHFAPAVLAPGASLRFPRSEPLRLEREVVELSDSRRGPPASSGPGSGSSGRARRDGAPPRAPAGGAWAGRSSRWRPCRSGSGCAAIAELARGPQRSRAGEPGRRRPPLLAVSRAEDRVLHLQCARPRCCTGWRRCSGPMRGSAWWSASLTALLAGAGAACLWRWSRPPPGARPLAPAGLAVLEYAPFPPWRWRDVLPDPRPPMARGAVRLPARARLRASVPASDSLASLAERPRGFAARRPTFDDCGEPQLGDKLDGDGLHARRGAAGQHWSGWRPSRYPQGSPADRSSRTARSWR